MSDLNQLLGEAFERRASVAGPGITPISVHAALRKQRVRTATVAAGVAVTCAAVGGTAVMAGAGRGVDRQAGSSRVRATTPAPTVSQDGTAVAQLPWAGNTTVTLRRGTTEAPAGYALCIAAYCFNTGTRGSREITLGSDGGTIVGLAPHGTRTMVATIGTQRPVSIPVSATDDPSLPGVLYGSSSISAAVPGPGAFSRTYRLTANDAHGRKIASLLVVGSADLALAHRPVGRLATLPSYTENTALMRVAWTDRSGWACSGERSGSGTDVTFGADVCIPPRKVDQVTLVADDAANQYVVLRVPPAVTSADLRGRNGTVVRASLTETGHGRLAVFDLSVGVLSADATVTCRNASGGIVLTASTKSLVSPAGTVGARP